MTSDSATLAAKLSAIEEATIALAAIVQAGTPEAGRLFLEQLEQKAQWAVETERSPQEVAAHEYLLRLARASGIG